MTDVRPLVLLRYLPGITGHTARTVHLVLMPHGCADAITALGGALLHSDQVKAVPPGQECPARRPTGTQQRYTSGYAHNDDQG
ncbi:MAG: hypothetical protein ACRDRA_21155 [Pseudonocardiaceae bacterium]